MAIADRFWQTVGLRLGFAIANAIVKADKNTIKIDSELGSQSAFSNVEKFCVQTFHIVHLAIAILQSDDNLTIAVGSTS